MLNTTTSLNNKSLQSVFIINKQQENNEQNASSKNTQTKKVNPQHVVSTKRAAQATNQTTTRQNSILAVQPSNVGNTESYAKLYSKGKKAAQNMLEKKGIYIRSFGGSIKFFEEKPSGFGTAGS